jgi:hypothetical protein
MVTTKSIDDISEAAVNLEKMSDTTSRSSSRRDTMRAAAATQHRGSPGLSTQDAEDLKEAEAKADRKKEAKRKEVLDEEAHERDKLDRIRSRARDKQDLEAGDARLAEDNDHRKRRKKLDDDHESKKTADDMLEKSRRLEADELYRKQQLDLSDRERRLRSRPRSRSRSPRKRSRSPRRRSRSRSPSRHSRSHSPRRSAQQTGPPVKPALPIYPVAAATGKRTKGLWRKLPALMCHECGDKNHEEKNCEKVKDLCFNCRVQGHRQGDCTQPRRPRGTCPRCSVGETFVHHNLKDCPKNTGCLYCNERSHPTYMCMNKLRLDATPDCAKYLN